GALILTRFDMLVYRSDMLHTSGWKTSHRFDALLLGPVVNKQFRLIEHQRINSDLAFGTSGRCCMGLRVWALSLSVSLVIHFCSLSQARADDVVLMAYGGHNETIGPYWVAIDKARYQKDSIDARLLQVRNAQISLTALISGEVPIFLPSIGNVLSGVSAGAKIGCVAFPIKGVSRELVVRKEIESLAALRGKTIGVQSIGGGFWLQTMMVLDGVGVDPDKIGMKMRVIGEEATIVQALLGADIDARAA